MMAKEQVKFPFEPNETVKAAFRKQAQFERATRLITEALVETAANCAVNPWSVLYKEHPEMLDAPKLLAYNSFFQTIDLKGKNDI